MKTAANLRKMLEGSQIRESHRECGRVQDAYSLRCIPQVHGAVRDTLAHCREVFETEANSAVDNPLVFITDAKNFKGDVISGGNFHGEPLAFALDFLGIALSALAGISERRIERLVNPALSEGLPPFLAQGAGLNSGFMMPQVTAAALVSENKVLAHPASVDSITTSGNKEDYVSMGMTAAIKLKRIVENTRNVLAIEAMAVAQAIDFLAPLKTSKRGQAAHAAIRSVCRYHGERPRHVQRFRADRGVDCQREGGGSYPLKQGPSGSRASALTARLTQISGASSLAALLMEPPTDSIQSKRQHVHYLLLAVAVLACLVPFSGKAFNVDDTLFIYVARQITQHPLDPFGFKVNWFLDAVPMAHETKNPPLASYYIAAAASFIGWSERALHLAFLLPALAVVWGTYRLALRFTNSPLLAAAATLLTPAFLVSASSVMCDTLMLALWLWAIIFWIEGLQPEKPHYLAVSALLITLCALTKYFGIALIPLLAAYSLARERRLGSWAWYLLLPILALTGYQRWTKAVYGLRMISEAAHMSAGVRQARQSSALAKALVDLSFVGWMHVARVDLRSHNVAAQETSRSLRGEWNCRVSH